MREVLYGSEFPQASSRWHVYLPAYGFFWWLIGEAGEASHSEPDSLSREAMRAEQPAAVDPAIRP